MHGRQKRGSKKNKQDRVSCSVCGATNAGHLIRIFSKLMPLCASCIHLSEEEVDYLSAVAEMRRCRTWDGFVPRKKRKTLDKMLHHRNSAVVELAAEISNEDQRRCRLSKASKERNPEFANMELEFQNWWEGRPERLSRQSEVVLEEFVY